MSLIHCPMRLLGVAMPAVLGFCFVQPAFALCKISSPSFVAQTIDLNLGEVSVPSNLQVGGVILTRTFPVTSKASTSFRCDLYGGCAKLALFQGGILSGVPGFGEGVLTTAVPGIGIRIRQTVAANGGGTSTHYYPVEMRYGALASFGIPSSNLVVELIKVNAVVGSGPIAGPGLLAGLILDGVDSFSPLLAVTLRAGGATIKPPTCVPSAGSKNIAVNFGAVSRSVFSGVGAVAGNRDFNIELDCQSSSVAGSTVGVRVDALQDASSMPGVMALTASTDAASGIAIQMVQRGAQGEQPLRFGETVVLASGAMNAGTLVLPLRARYIQTSAGAVGPGRAGGMATFTIQYN